MDALFALADSNQSGTIDLEEFALMIRGMNPKDDEPLAIESSQTDEGTDQAASPQSTGSGGFNPFQAFRFGGSEPSSPKATEAS